MCKKCSKIVAKNYRVENLGKKQACFACADEHGTKLTRMDDEDSVSSRTSSASISTFTLLFICCSPFCYKRLLSGRHPRIILTFCEYFLGEAEVPHTLTAGHFISHKSIRSTSEPIHRQQQQLLNVQRHAEMLRQRSQTQGVPERIRLDTSSPTGPQKGEQRRHVASHHEGGIRRREQNPFTAGKPTKSASDKGQSSDARDPERTATVEEMMTEPTPEAAAVLDLSYLSSYK